MLPVLKAPSSEQAQWKHHVIIFMTIIVIVIIIFIKKQTDS